jgi:hypothetical protein
MKECLPYFNITSTRHLLSIIFAMFFLRQVNESHNYIISFGPGAGLYDEDTLW